MSKDQLASVFIENKVKETRSGGLLNSGLLCSNVKMEL